MTDPLPSSTCPDCGELLPPESPQSLCPACLMRQALASRTITRDGEGRFAERLTIEAELLARTKDSSKWNITVRNADPKLTSDQRQRVVDAVTVAMGDRLRHTSSSSISPTVLGRWSLVFPWLVLAGVWTGLAGALLLRRRSLTGRGKLYGKIAVGALWLSVPVR